MGCVAILAAFQVKQPSNQAAAGFGIPNLNPVRAHLDQLQF